jgi:hypothetical protein
MNFVNEMFHFVQGNHACLTSTDAAYLGAFQRGRKTRLFLVELSFTRVFESNFSRISEEVPTKKLDKIWSSFP